MDFYSHIPPPLLKHHPWPRLAVPTRSRMGIVCKDWGVLHGGTVGLRITRYTDSTTESTVPWFMYTVHILYTYCTFTYSIRYSTAVYTRIEGCRQGFAKGPHAGYHGYGYGGDMVRLGTSNILLYIRWSMKYSVQYSTVPGTTRESSPWLYVPNSMIHVYSIAITNHTVL